MANVSHSQRIFPFCNQIKLRRFDDSTLRILDAILSSKDAKLLMELRSSLKEFLRSEALIVIREAAEKPLEQKLLVLDFLVCAFAIIDDVESCLAVRYEALIMRESSTVSHPQLQVSCSEWMNFAEDALDKGLYSIASKACEHALLCLHMKCDARRDSLFENGAIVDKIQSFKNVALRLSASHSVQVQAAEYLKEKNLSQKQSLVCNESQYPASISFRNAIKKRNVRDFLRFQNLQQGQGYSNLQY